MGVPYSTPSSAFPMQTLDIGVVNKGILFIDAIIEINSQDQSHASGKWMYNRNYTPINASDNSWSSTVVIYPHLDGGRIAASTRRYRVVGSSLEASAPHTITCVSDLYGDSSNSWCLPLNIYQAY